MFILGSYKEALWNEKKYSKTDDSSEAGDILQQRKRKRKLNKKYRDESISPPPRINIKSTQC